MATTDARRRRSTAVITALALAAGAGIAGGWTLRGLADPGDRPATQVMASSSTVPGAGLLDHARPAAYSSGCSAPQEITSLPKKQGRVVALTFDDGPSPEVTPQILAILKDKGVNATFFETGEHSTAHPELVREVVRAGHAVGSHSWNHPRLTDLSATAITDQIDRATAAVSAAVGAPVCLARAPFGLTDARVEGISRALGLTTVGWTQNPQDWLNPTPAKLRADSAPWSDHPPTILLLHEHGSEQRQQQGPSPTVAALPGIIDDYHAAGYRFVQVDGRAFPADPALTAGGTTARG